MHHAHNLAALAPFVLFVLFCYWAGQPSDRKSPEPPSKDR